VSSSSECAVRLRDSEFDVRCLRKRRSELFGARLRRRCHREQFRRLHLLQPPPTPVRQASPPHRPTRGQKGTSGGVCVVVNRFINNDSLSSSSNSDERDDDREDEGDDGCDDEDAVDSSPACAAVLLRLRRLGCSATFNCVASILSAAPPSSSRPPSPPPWPTEAVSSLSSCQGQER
jgi:hypothetical protein